MSDTFGMAQLEAELSRDEGVRFSPYRDSVGIESVGIGHNLQAGPLPGQTYPMTQAQVDALFARDITSTITKLDANLPWWRKLDPVRQRVLIEMCFNLGIGSVAHSTGLLGFHGFLSLVQQAHYLDASHDMLTTLWAKQVGARADRLATMMAMGSNGPAVPILAPTPPKPPAATPSGFWATLVAFFSNLTKGL